jgi:hypothetical protein
MRVALPIGRNRESDHADNLSARNTAQICRAAQRLLEVAVDETKAYGMKTDQLKVTE